MTTPVLNLDELTQVRPVLIWKGEEYEMVEMTMRKFLDAQKKSAELKQQIESGEVEEDDDAGMNETLDMISGSFPGISRDDLMGMTSRELHKIMNFIVKISTADADEDLKEKKS